MRTEWLIAIMITLNQSLNILTLSKIMYVKNKRIFCEEFCVILNKENLGVYFQQTPQKNIFSKFASFGEKIAPQKCFIVTLIGQQWDWKLSFFLLHTFCWTSKIFFCSNLKMSQKKFSHFNPIKIQLNASSIDK